MSFLKKVFGKNKNSPPTTLAETIQKVKETEAMLIKKQNYLETRVEKEIAIAKSNASKNKKAAIEALKKKKRFEGQLQHIDGALTTIEAQLDILEAANANSLVVTSMKTASDALKTANKCLNLDEIDAIKDELDDQRDITEGISNLITNPVGFTEDLDEEELERELQELEDEEAPKLPAVPKDGVMNQMDKTRIRKKEEPTKVNARAS